MTTLLAVTGLSGVCHANLLEAVANQRADRKLIVDDQH